MMTPRSRKEKQQTNIQNRPEDYPSKGTS